MADQQHTTPTPTPDLAPVPPTASVDAELLAPSRPNLHRQTVDARLMAINDEIMAETRRTPFRWTRAEPAAVHDRWSAQIVDRGDRACPVYPHASRMGRQGGNIIRRRDPAMWRTQALARRPSTTSPCRWCCWT